MVSPSSIEPKLVGVIPIHKKVRKTDKMKYIPIAILSSSKVSETLL